MQCGSKTHAQCSLVHNCEREASVGSAAEMLRPLKCLRWICQEENRLFTLTGLKSGDTATKAHGKRLFVFQTITWAGEMAQRVKVLAVKTERQSWTPGTHMAEGEWLLQVVLTPTWALVCIPLLLQKCNNTKKQKTKGGTCEVEAGRLL